MTARWAAVQRLHARLTALAAQPPEPRQAAHHARVPPSPSPQATRPTGPRTGTRRDARGGRAGGGRPWPPTPDHSSRAPAQTCPPGGGVGRVQAPPLQAVDDTRAWSPVTPMVTRVEPAGGACPHGGPTAVAPVPGGMAPGTPVAASMEGRAPSRRSTQAIRDARRSALWTPGSGVPSSDGAWATRCRWVHRRLAHRVAERRTRLRRSRLSGRDDTGARVHGRPPGAWVVQHPDGGGPVLRPSPGHGGLPAILGDQRPTLGVSDRSRAPPQHPAAP
jgi:transposase